MKESEASQVVAVIAAAYPNARLSERTCQVYETMLADLEFGTAQRALARLLATAKFPPTIAEIRSTAVEMTRGPRRTGIEAWGDVVAAAETCRPKGPGFTPTFEDSDVAAVVKSLGWHQLCFGDESAEASNRARFVEAYDIVSRQRWSEAVTGDSARALSDRTAGRLTR